MRIRLARPEEHVLVDDLVERAYGHDYGPAEPTGDPMRRAAARAGSYDVWVAVADPSEGGGRARADADLALLGTVTTRRAGGPPLHEEVPPESLDLRLLGVAPEARRLGVGAALMRLVAQRASELGFAAVELKTGEEMRGAHALYERLGYARHPEHDGLIIGGRRVRELRCYRLELASAPGEAARDAQVAADAGAGPDPAGAARADSARREPRSVSSGIEEIVLTL